MQREPGNLKQPVPFYGGGPGSQEKEGGKRTIEGEEALYGLAAAGASFFGGAWLREVQKKKGRQEKTSRVINPRGESTGGLGLSGSNKRRLLVASAPKPGAGTNRRAQDVFRRQQLRKKNDPNRCVHGEQNCKK